MGVNEIEVIKKARWRFTPRQEPKSISLLWGPVLHSKCQRDGCKSRSRVKGLFKKQERRYELWEERGAGKWKHFAQNHPVACNKCPRSAVYRAEPERNSFTLPERQKLVRRWHLSFYRSRNVVWNSRYRLLNEMSWSQFLLILCCNTTRGLNDDSASAEVICCHVNQQKQRWALCGEYTQSRQKYWDTTLNYWIHVFQSDTLP